MIVVKICGLTSYDDARWAWQCGAGLLGFIFVPASRRYVLPTHAGQIIRALSDEGCSALFVGVFADEPIASCRDIARACRLSMIQLHGNESPAYANALDLPFIVARRVRDRVPWDELSQYRAWAYLLDSYHAHALGGTGQTWHWELMGKSGHAAEGPNKRVILAGGLTPENVGAAIRQARPWGVDVSSGVETQPGRKDSLKVERFIQNVRSAGRNAREDDQR